MIAGIVSFLIALTLFVRGIRVHFRLQKLDLAIARQRLLEEIDTLRTLEAEVQVSFHPLMLERFAAVSDATTMRSIQEKADEYGRCVTATLELQEMILSGEANSPYALKLIETHIVAAKSVCTFLEERMPALLKVSKLGLTRRSTRTPRKRGAG